MAAKAADIVLLALPNGKSHAFVQAAEGMAGDPLLVDISADHRFGSDWHYGLPELNRRDWSGGRRISNPCSRSRPTPRASGAAEGWLAAAAGVFGVTGHSGGARQPSRP